MISKKAAVAEMLGLPPYRPLDEVVKAALEQIPVFFCDRPWTVVACRHAREEDVASQLVDAGWLIYLPKEVRWCGGGVRRRAVKRPLFPRYVFAACLPEGDVAATAEMRHVIAVRRREGGSVVRPVLMRALMASHAAGAFDETVSKAKRCALPAGFRRDQQVRIVDGVLSGWEARVLEVLSSHEVRVLVDVFGKEGSFPIDTSKLELA